MPLLYPSRPSPHVTSCGTGSSGMVGVSRTCVGSWGEGEGECEGESEGESGGEGEGVKGEW